MTDDGLLESNSICVRVEPRLLWNVQTGQTPEEFEVMIRRGVRRLGQLQIEPLVLPPGLFKDSA